MIFPIIPGDFNDFNQPPSLKLSWMILALNFFIYFLILCSFKQWPSKNIQQQLADEKVVRSINEMYLQTLDPAEKSYLSANHSENRNLIFLRALKDQNFWSRLAEFPFVGDQLQIIHNKKIIKEFYEGYYKSPQYYFGLSSNEASPWSWVTYQFVHVSFLHLLSNSILIFLLISYLEKTVNIEWIAMTYLFSGFAGGISFLFFDSLSGISVIGGSASASGLMSFLLVVKCDQLMPWGYWISPSKAGFGHIYLPVFFIFPIFLISDFISLLWEPSGVVSNVAVSAHVGGVFMGLIVGVYYLLFLRGESTAHHIFSDHDRLHELP